MDNNPFSMNWTDNWNKLQKKMWSDWLSMAQKNGFNSNTAANPFNFFQQSMEESVDPMWSAFSPFQAKTPEDMARHSMMGAMNNFMEMSKGVFDTFQNMSAKGGNSSEEWTVELDKNLKKFREFFTLPNQANFGSLNPMSGWTEMVDNNPMFSNDMMKNFMGSMSGMQGGSSMESLFTDSLAMPGLGLNREKQEKMQKAMQLGLEYQKVMAEFQTLMNQSSLKAADLFKKRLMTKAKDGESLESLRDLHVLWVDCSEETNAKTVSSKEYQEINPRLTKALLTLQQHTQSMTDDNMSALNMPTRKELNSAYLQIHGLKKMVRKLESQIKTQSKQSDSAKLNRLRDELENLDIDALRRDVEELKKQLKSASKTPAKTASKSAAKSGAKSAAKSGAKITTRPAAKVSTKAAAKKIPAKAAVVKPSVSKTKATVAKAKPSVKSSTKKGA